MTGAPERAYDVIVAGSGVAGLSSAWQLAKRGARVLVLEKGRLGGGATGRAAGLIGQMRASVAEVKMLMESVQILRELEEAVNYRLYFETGSVRVAQTEARAQELWRDAALCREAGLDVSELPISECERHVPGMRTDDLIAAAFCASDGYVEPPSVARALVDAGRLEGVEYLENTPIEEIIETNRAVRGVIARGEEYIAPAVVNAAGIWARLTPTAHDANVPVAAISHFYLTTTADSGVALPPDAATLRDRENRIYSRPCAGGLRVGIYETQPVAVNPDALPPGFSMDEMTLERSHPVIQTLLEAARQRFPALNRDTNFTVAGGLMAFSPDGHSILGTQRPNGLYHCAGFCGHGVSQAGIAGKIMAQLILDGDTTYPIEWFLASRYGQTAARDGYEAIEKRCLAAYANYYSLPQSIVDEK